MVAWKTAPEYQEVPQPEPGPGQVLVRVGAAGICHSDLHVIHEFDAGVFNAELPFTLGHETAGWVEALGTGATGVEVGEAVAVHGPLSCGTCARCTTGDDSICDHLPSCRRPASASGSTVAWRRTWSSTASASWRRSATSTRCWRHRSRTPRDAVPGASGGRSEPRASFDAPGSTAVVIGVGGLGHLAVQILRAVSPATVIAVDSKPAALELAASLGAHHTVEAGPDAAAADHRAGEGRGADATFDLVGNEATLTLALATARAGSRITLVGVAGGSVPTRSGPPRARSS